MNTSTRVTLLLSVLGSVLEGTSTTNVQVPRAQLINQVTGANASHPTLDVDVMGCDLGIMTQIQRGMRVNELVMFFGDTFGRNSTFGPGGARTDWRSNTMTFPTLIEGKNQSSTQLLAQHWRTNSTGAASELVPGLHDTTFSSELTKIPTSVHGQGSSIFMWFMSVRKFEGDNWDCNYASLAVANFSDVTENTSFKVNSDFVFPKESKFHMFAIVSMNDSSVYGGTCPLNEEYIYMLATPCGRLGEPYLLRTLKDGIDVLSQYEQFTGIGKVGPKWALVASSTEQPKALFSSGTGELSVVWHDIRQVFVAIYTAPASRIVIRTAPCLWGPWSAETLIADETLTGNFVYGGFSHFSMIRGDWIYFSLSQWQPYNVWLSRFNLSEVLDG